MFTVDSTMTAYLAMLLACATTIVVYQCWVMIAQKVALPLLNPMLMTMLSLVGLLLAANIGYQDYQQGTRPLNFLLELSVVALGFPLYQHLHTMKHYWRRILMVSCAAVVFAISSGYLLTYYWTENDAIAVALALKSITTPIALLISEQLDGNIAITAFSIVIAGLCGAIGGIKWLEFIGVNQGQTQGLAIGSASHALGTATVSRISYLHAAYSSLALILSATLTAFISPILIPLLRSLVKLNLG